MNNPALLLDDIVEATFRKGESNLFFKKAFSGETAEIQILKTCFIKTELWKSLPATINSRRGIPLSKKEGILGCLTMDL